MKRWMKAIVFLFFLLAAGCHHTVPVVDVKGSPPPIVKKIPLTVAILITDQMENYTYTARATVEAGLSHAPPHTFPLGQLLKKTSLVVFSYIFDKAMLTKGDPYPLDIDAVIIPTMGEFSYKIKQTDRLAVRISLKVALVDKKGMSLWEGLGTSPEIPKTVKNILSVDEWMEAHGSATAEAVAAALTETAVAMARSQAVQNYAAAKVEPAIPPSRPAPIIITKPSPEEKLPISRNQFAVIIGIAQYKNTKVPPLKYTKSDALAVYKWLLSPKGGGYPEKNIELLIDQQANLVNIRTALGTWLARRALKHDTVFIFYAGHGAPEPDAKSDDGYAKYLVPYDADPDNLYATALPMKEMADIFDRIEAERIIFVADACYSGASGGRTLFRPGSRAISITSQFLDQLSQAKGRVVITASDTNEVSGEIDDLQHGIFTYYLLEALSGEADTNKDGVVDLREAYEYLYEKVARHSKLAGYSQHPVWKGDMRGRILLGVAK